MTVIRIPLVSEPGGLKTRLMLGRPGRSTPGLQTVVPIRGGGPNCPPAMNYFNARSIAASNCIRPGGIRPPGDHLFENKEVLICSYQLNI